MPHVNGVVETALYVENVARSIEFYQKVFGWPVMDSNERFCALNVCDRHVLLLFKTGGTREAISVPGGVIPPHDGSGQLHAAFAISAPELAEWETWLTEKGVEIESRVTWPRAGRSLYFRDPDGNLLELATPGVWPNY
ncbi:MAG: VOC family protein [Terriglobia bacterium]